jgi:hypothetical protein
MIKKPLTFNAQKQIVAKIEMQQAKQAAADESDEETGGDEDVDDEEDDEEAEDATETAVESDGVSADDVPSTTKLEVRRCAFLVSFSAISFNHLTSTESQDQEGEGH